MYCLFLFDGGQVQRSQFADDSRLIVYACLRLCVPSLIVCAFTCIAFAPGSVSVLEEFLNRFISS